MTGSIKKKIIISGVCVEVARKTVRHIRLRVMSPDGSVRLSVPGHVSDDAVLDIISSRLDWIKEHRDRIRRQSHSRQHEFVTGEIHYYQGRPFRLEVVRTHGRHVLFTDKDETMILQVRSGTSRRNKALVLDRWYKKQLDLVMPELLGRWQPIIGRNISGWHIKRMKTRWGSCNIATRKISINLELAKKPVSCLEYVLVHELVHLHERYHNANFRRLMDYYLPDWRQRKTILEGKTEQI